MVETPKLEEKKAIANYLSIICPIQKRKQQEQNNQNNSLKHTVIWIS